MRAKDGKAIRFPSGKLHGRVLAPGEAFILRSGGGGGYGSPLERPVETIEQDVFEGYISRERAQRCYGVVFEGDTGRIDRAATVSRRAALAGNGALVAMRENEDAANESSTGALPEGVYLLQGSMFPLRCC